MTKHLLTFRTQMPDSSLTYAKNVLDMSSAEKNLAIASSRKLRNRETGIRWLNWSDLHLEILRDYNSLAATY